MQAWIYKTFIVEVDQVGRDSEMNGVKLSDRLFSITSYPQGILYVDLGRLWQWEEKHRPSFFFCMAINNPHIFMMVLKQMNK